VVFSAGKTPSKVTLICHPQVPRPLEVDCLITRPNLMGPIVVQPLQTFLQDHADEDRSIVIECHFAFPSIMKTCIGGVKVAKLQFRLFRVSQGLPPMLIDTFYRDGDLHHLPIVAYPHTKAKIQCWALIIWSADKVPEFERLPWRELAQRFGYFYQRQLGEDLHPQSIRFLAEKLGIFNQNVQTIDDEIVPFEAYMQSRVGHWLYNAVQAIKQYYDLWRNYSLRMFLTHKDAIALLKSLNAQPGDFLFRIPSQLTDDVKTFKTRSPSSNLVFTYAYDVGGELKFAKVDINDKVRENRKFIYEKKELVNVMCLNEKGEIIRRNKRDCCFNESQKQAKQEPQGLKLSGNDDEYETY